MSDLVSSVQSQVTSITDEMNSLQETVNQSAADPMAFIQALMAAQSAQSSNAGGGVAGAVNGASGPSFSGGVSGGDVVNQAEKYLGVPYVWGGESTSGFDCSGLVQQVFSNLGISLPRGSDAQSQVGTPISSIAQAQPGDLLFFNSDGDPTGHVGIYAGNGMMVDAAHTGTTVRIEPVWSSLTSIRRVVQPSLSESAQNGFFNTSLMVQVPGQGVVSSASSLGLVPTGASSGSTSLGGNVPSNLVPLFMSAATKYGIPPQLLASVAQVESGFNPNAVSSAGAEGLMQIMPSTASGIGVNPMDPAQAINGAAQILSGYISAFGSVPLALAAYNAGPGAVEQYGGIPPYAETESYVNQVMALMGTSAS
ncbi:MAG TPA: transglycosylase SLT domain-containing protein [Acidimicrobiales bacterium]|nr:transglycosylase SLT domain-containing protein [Acidimicrobiales bacterium]